MHAHVLGVPAPRRRRVTIFVRDWIFIVVLLFMAGLVASKWSDYSRCTDPMAAWLVTNFLGLLLFRCLHFLAQYLWNGPAGTWLASKGPGVVIAADLYLVWPFMLTWMALGCVWYNRDHECLPRSMSGWAYVAWIVLTLVYLFSYASLVFGQVRGRASYPLDPEVEPGSCAAWTSALASTHQLVVEFLQRQELLALGLGPDAQRGPAAAGHIIVLQRQQHDADGALPLVVQQQQMQARPHTGLTPEQIEQIPLRELTPAERCGELCSICLVNFAQLPPSAAAAAEEGVAGAEGQPVGTAPASASASAGSTAVSSPDVEVSSTGRTSASRLYSSAPVTVYALDCGHCFHVDCLRVWLREEAKCPNCRTRIGPEPRAQEAAPAPAPEHEQAEFIRLQWMAAQQQAAAAAAQQSPHSEAQMHMRMQQQQQDQMHMMFIRASPSSHQQQQQQLLHAQQPSPFAWQGARLEANIAPSPAASPYARHWQQ